MIHATLSDLNMHYGNEGLYGDLIWAQLPTEMIQIDTLISIVIAVNLREWFDSSTTWFDLSTHLPKPD